MASDTGLWTYRRAGCTGGVAEVGAVLGRQVALPLHFHDEDQLAFVIAGQRRFVIGQSLHGAGPGRSVHIRAGTPHRSLAEGVDVVCLNLYLAPGCHDVPALQAALTARWRSGASFDEATLYTLAEAHRIAAPAMLVGAERPGPAPTITQTIEQAARAAGLTREAYSRRFRRRHGMPPETHRLLLRVNEARRGLRAGAPIAEVAVAAGFADQSHLGRIFRRVFGVTPGRYRAG